MNKALIVFESVKSFLLFNYQNILTPNINSDICNQCESSVQTQINKRAQILTVAISAHYLLYVHTN